MLPVLALVLSFALWAVSAAAAQVRCSDAAREGARAAARGDPEGQVRQLALGAAPPNSSVTILRTGGDVRVRVASQVRWLGHGPVSVSVSAIAVAALEPDGGAEIASSSAGPTVGRRPSG